MGSKTGVPSAGSDTAARLLACPCLSSRVDNKYIATVQQEGAARG